MVDAFRMHIMQTKELGTCPVRQIGGCSFFYMRISNVYIVIVVSSNANVACAFKFVVEVIGILLLLKFPNSLPSLVFHVSFAIVYSFAAVKRCFRLINKSIFHIHLFPLCRLTWLCLLFMNI